MGVGGGVTGGAGGGDDAAFSVIFDGEWGVPEGGIICRAQHPDSAILRAETAGVRASGGGGPFWLGAATARALGLTIADTPLRAQALGVGAARRAALEREIIEALIEQADLPEALMRERRRLMGENDD